MSFQNNQSFFSERNIFSYDTQNTTSKQDTGNAVKDWSKQDWRKQPEEPTTNTFNPAKFQKFKKQFAAEKSFKKLGTDRGRIMVFIDGSNLFYTANMLNLEFDYIKLVEVLIEPKLPDDKLLRVYFYTGVDPNTDSHVNWLYFMRRTGFKMVTKNLVTFPDGTRKANCDVEMAVDMVTLANSYDTAIVVTGDGDLTRAVEHLVNHGIQVHICGHRSNTSEQLIKSADRFIDLELIKGQISLNRFQNNTTYVQSPQDGFKPQKVEHDNSPTHAFE